MEIAQCCKVQMNGEINVTFQGIVGTPAIDLKKKKTPRALL